MRSYTENCLLIDIDKDFFIDVASDYSLYCYKIDYPIINRDVSSPQDSSSITLMRCMLERRMDTVHKIMQAKDIGNPDEKTHLIATIKAVKDRDEAIYPYRFFNESEKIIQFVKNVCMQRNIHPADRSNRVPYRDIRRHYSAYTILSGYEEEFLKLVLNKQKWSILILILLSEKYSILYEEESMEEKVERIQQTFVTLNDSDDGMSNYTLIIEELLHKDKILTMNKEKKTLEFKSEDIRHQVMGYFVLNCLEMDDDYKNYFKLSSFDSVFDYVRTVEYKHDRGEKGGRCLYLPREMEETFVRESGIDILRHVTMAEIRIQYMVSIILKIPSEILYWDYKARCRYVECAKKGTQTIHRARAMIVGCAGAGKTTLLKRLQKRSLSELQQVQSTIGLEVHEDIFEIFEEKDFLNVDKSIPTSSAFDVTLLYKLLRNYGPNLPTPTKGWWKTPEPGQKSPTDDVERIRVYRNEAEHKTPATSVMEKEDCRVKWRDLCQAILRLSEGSLEQDIMNLRHQD